MNNVITKKGIERIKKEYDSVVPIWGDQCGIRRTRKYNTSPPQRNLLFNVQKLVCSEFITLETERPPVSSGPSNFQVCTAFTQTAIFSPSAPVALLAAGSKFSF
jgi:hypothetical protein